MADSGGLAGSAARPHETDRFRDDGMREGEAIMVHDMTGQRPSGRVALWLLGWVVGMGLWGGAVPALHAQWATSGNNISNTNSGNVGINTTTPDFKLDVENGALVSSFPSGQPWGLGIRTSQSWSGGWARQFAFFSDSGAQLAAIKTQGAGDTVDHVAIGVGLDASGADGGSWLLIKAATGNVGIGTTTPAVKLDVNGDLNVSGNIGAKYQDIAEWVPSTQTLAPGTVVVLATDRVNAVVPSARAYDTTVAGVVSAQPGLLLGEGGTAKVKVATTGRVRVKVDARGRPIQTGDLLVTSAEPGTAMPSEPVEIHGRRWHQPGTILGKALEPLAEGTGEILVLLTLQ